MRLWKWLRLIFTIRRRLDEAYRQKMSEAFLAVKGEEMPKETLERLGDILRAHPLCKDEPLDLDRLLF